MKTVLQELQTIDREKIWKYLAFRYEEYEQAQQEDTKLRMFHLIDHLLVRYKDDLQKDEIDIDNVVVPYSSFDYENNQWFIGMSTMSMAIEDLYQTALPDVPTLRIIGRTSTDDGEMVLQFTEDENELAYMLNFIQEMSDSCHGGNTYLVCSWDEVVNYGVPEQTLFDVEYILADVLYCMTIWGFDIDQREVNRKAIMKKIGTFAKKMDKTITSACRISLNDTNTEDEEGKKIDDREPGTFEIERLNTDYISFCSLYASILMIKEDCKKVMC